MAVLRLWVVVLLFIPVVRAQSVVETHSISVEEREALMTLYQSTGGSKWIHRDGWLGPPGSECQWYGVECGRAANGQLAGRLMVQGLDLRENGLSGKIPPDVGALKGLRRFNVRGNAVKAPLPDVLLQRWDEGQVEVDPLSVVHDVEEVFLHLSNPELLCYGYRAKMTAEGAVSLERKLCREHGGQQTRIVYCEYRHGRTYEFDRLGRFLVRNDFFASSDPRVATSERDLGGMIVTAKRSGGSSQVHHSSTGPISLSDWSLQVMLEGIVARVEWAAPAKEGPCSSRNDP